MKTKTFTIDINESSDSAEVVVTQRLENGLIKQTNMTVELTEDRGCDWDFWVREELSDIIRNGMI